MPAARLPYCLLGIFSEVTQKHNSDLPKQNPPYHTAPRVTSVRSEKSPVKKTKMLIHSHVTQPTHHTQAAVFIGKNMSLAARYVPFFRDCAGYLYQKPPLPVDPRICEILECSQILHHGKYFSVVDELIICRHTFSFFVKTSIFHSDCFRPIHDNNLLIL